MGVLCESCENKNNDDSDSPKNNSKINNKPEIFLLPKHYVSEKIPENKNINNIELLNENKEGKESEKKTFNKKNYSKAKTILNLNVYQSAKSQVYISKLSKVIERSNSLDISEEKKIKIINKEMQNLENKSTKFKKRLSKVK